MPQCQYWQKWECLELNSGAFTWQQVSHVQHVKPGLGDPHHQITAVQMLTAAKAWMSSRAAFKDRFHWKGSRSWRWRWLHLSLQTKHTCMKVWTHVSACRTGSFFLHGLCYLSPLLQHRGFYFSCDFFLLFFFLLVYKELFTLCQLLPHFDHAHIEVYCLE